MPATSRPRRPVIEILIVALTGLAGCSSAETLASSVLDSGNGASFADASSDSSSDASSDPSSKVSCGAPRWNARYGGSAADDSQAREGGLAVAVDPTGNVFITGTYLGDADFGGGPRPSGGSNTSMFLAKLDTAGGHLWSKGFGYPTADAGMAPSVQGYAVAADADGNVVVAGTMAGIVDFGGGPLRSADALAPDGGPGLGNTLDAVVAKFDASGAHAWSRIFGSEGAEAVRGATFDARGNVYLAGSFQATMNLGGSPLVSAGKSDAWVAKLDPDGHPSWSVGFGGAGDDAATSIAIDSAGNLIVGGVYSDTVAFGASSFRSAGAFDGFLIKLDADGHVVWAKSAKTTGKASVQRMAVDKQDAIAVLGTYQGSADLGVGAMESVFGWDNFVAKFDKAGNLAWVKSYGGDGDDLSSAIAIDESGRIVFAGQMRSPGGIDFGGGTVGGGTDARAFVVQLDASSAHVCSRSYGGPAAAQAVTVDAKGHVIVTGNFSAKLDIGLGPMVSTGGEDIFVTAFDP